MILRITFVRIAAISLTHPPQRRRKDVVKRLNFSLKDVLHWSEMEVATTFFKTSSRRLRLNKLCTLKTWK